MNKLIKELEKIEAAPLGNARLEAIKKADSEDMRRLFVYALSSDITFGVKQVPKALPSQIASLDEKDWFDLLVSDLLEPLSVRSLTGNDAKSRIGSFLGLCSPEEQKWTERILKQDLRLSVGAKDINKVCPGTFTLFQVALAEDYNKIKDKDLLGRWCIQPKLDGARCVAQIPNDNRKQVKLFSRTGKIWFNFESIRRTLQEFSNSDSLQGDLWLDGEVICLIDGKINFQALQNNLHRKESNEEGKLIYVIFDRMWGEFTPHENYEVRHSFVKTNIIPLINRYNKNIKVVDSSIAENPTRSELEEASRQFVIEGYEGLMARRADTFGKMKRSKDLLKVKAFQDSEARIIGRIEGMGRLLGSLGALVCELPSGVKFEIGTGFDDQQRSELWDADIIGKQVNFKYFEITNGGIPRFPVYRSLRHADDIG